MTLQKNIWMRFSTLHWRLSQASGVNLKNLKKGDEDPPPLVLKSLPPGLRYEFLDKEGKYPVILDNKLSSEENTKLLEVLVKQHETFGYTLNDIKVSILP